MPKQPSLNALLYGRGVTRTKSGHLQYRSPKELRGELVHRVIVKNLIEETNYGIRCYIPVPYEVHHMDYNGTNNDPSNFLLLSEAFHAKLTADRRRDDGGRFGRKFVPKWKAAPQMLLDLKDEVENQPPF